MKRVLAVLSLVAFFAAFAVPSQACDGNGKCKGKDAAGCCMHKASTKSCCSSKASCAKSEASTDAAASTTPKTDAASKSTAATKVARIAKTASATRSNPNK